MTYDKKAYFDGELGHRTYTVFNQPLVGLSGIERFSRRLKTRKENVAEHMWYVSYITLHICRTLKLSDDVTLLALEYAICHDVPELVLDDVNHDVKDKFPAIEHALSVEEDKLFGLLDRDVQKVHRSDESYPGYRVARAIVDLADVHSVAMYIESEANLGSTYFDTVYRQILSRIMDREDDLWRALEYGGKTD